MKAEGCGAQFSDTERQGHIPGSDPGRTVSRGRGAENRLPPPRANSTLLFTDGEAGAQGGGSSLPR